MDLTYYKKGSIVLLNLQPYLAQSRKYGKLNITDRFIE